MPADERPHGFTADGVRRIVKAVRGYEAKNYGYSIGPPEHRGFEPVWLKITGNASGGGKYIGQLFGVRDGVTIPESGNLTEAELGVAIAGDVLILNPAELGTSTHVLTASGVPAAPFLGTQRPSRSSSGKAVYILERSQNGNGVPNGTAVHQTLRWNGTAWVPDWIRAHG